MKQAVLISINPQWCELIASGEKAVEIRKTVPKLSPPFTCYIYCTNGTPWLLKTSVKNSLFIDKEYKPGDNLYGLYEVMNGTVIGEFTCDNIEAFTTDYRMNRKQTERLSEQSRVGMVELMEYEGNAPCLYAWHISNLKIYPQAKRLGEFCYLRNIPVNRPAGITDELFPLERPPQSWCYVKEN